MYFVVHPQDDMQATVHLHQRWHTPVSYQSQTAEFPLSFNPPLSSYRNPGNTCKVSGFLFA